MPRERFSCGQINRRSGGRKTPSERAQTLKLHSSWKRGRLICRFPNLPFSLSLSHHSDSAEVTNLAPTLSLRPRPPGLPSLSGSEVERVGGGSVASPLGSGVCSLAVNLNRTARWMDDRPKRVKKTWGNCGR